MRVCWSRILLLAAVASLPVDGLATPCLEKACFTQNLISRKAEAAIIPVPKPVVPPVLPKPITPKPIAPRPKIPETPPKPLEPAKPPSGPGIQCKRVPGDPCSNIPPFTDAQLEKVRTKGRDVQASLAETQKANPPAQDAERTSVIHKLSHIELPDLISLFGSDDSDYLDQSGVQISNKTGAIWTQSSTRNQEAVNPTADDNILVTFTSTQDRVMVIIDSETNEDEMARAEENVSWSDMAMFDLRKAFGKKKIKPDQLKYIIWSKIKGSSSAKQTQDWIEAAITRTRGDRTKVNTFRSDPEAPGVMLDEIAAYQLLAGSDHVSEILLMLKDYPETMENVRVESLSVTTPETEGAGKAYNIVIKLVKLANP